MRLFAPRPDPVTGDQLSFSEQVSWFLQGIIRRWPTVVFYIVGSALWWHANGLDFRNLLHDPDLAHWNVLASLMAIVIESIVGIAMFSQTKRDAQVLRRVARLEEALLRMEEAQGSELKLLRRDTVAIAKTIAALLREARVRPA